MGKYGWNIQFFQANNQNRIKSQVIMLKEKLAQNIQTINREIDSVDPIYKYSIVDGSLTINKIK